jgi:hypothetical protein
MEDYIGAIRKKNPAIKKINNFILELAYSQKNASLPPRGLREYGAQGSLIFPSEASFWE